MAQPVGRDLIKIRSVHMFTAPPF